MSFRSGFVFAIVLSLLGTCWAQTPFPDNPKNHWVYVDIQKIKRDGLLVGYPDGLGGGVRPLARYNVAVMVFQCYENLQMLALGADIEMKKPGLLPIGRDSSAEANAYSAAVQAQKEYLSYTPDCSDCVDLIAEFAPEIKDLGKDPVELKRQVLNYSFRFSHLQASKPGSALVQFTDVPSDHWAAQAVLDLRKLGILQGYPSGKFDPEK